MYIVDDGTPVPEGDESQDVQTANRVSRPPMPEPVETEEDAEQ